MKKIYTIIMSITIIITLVMFGKMESNAMGNDPLLEMVQVFQSNHIQVGEWNLYTKQNLSHVKDESSFHKRIEVLKNKTNQYAWTIEKQEGKTSATGVFQHDGITETIKLISILKKNTYHSYLLYEAHGSIWDEELYKNFKPSYTQTVTDIFQDNPTIFTCIKGEINDKMESVLYSQVELLLEEFEAIPIESLSEETFASVSAYTEKWNNTIPTSKKSMNIQIALRKTGLGGKTTVVVGTPIITSEY
ncbi:YwmB family TATA-box binding protein [Bacillus timonensis]|nr:YwmB family TATA-box binding protein [Bacillus timonensis]